MTGPVALQKHSLTFKARQYPQTCLRGKVWNTTRWERFITHLFPPPPVFCLTSPKFFRQGRELEYSDKPTTSSSLTESGNCYQNRDQLLCNFLLSPRCQAVWESLQTCQLKSAESFCDLWAGRPQDVTQISRFILEFRKLDRSLFNLNLRGLTL